MALGSAGLPERAGSGLGAARDRTSLRGSSRRRCSARCGRGWGIEHARRVFGSRARDRHRGRGGHAREADAGEPARRRVAVVTAAASSPLRRGRCVAVARRDARGGRRRRAPALGAQTATRRRPRGGTGVPRAVRRLPRLRRAPTARRPRGRATPRRQPAHHHHEPALRPRLLRRRPRPVRDRAARRLALRSPAAGRSSACRAVRNELPSAACRAARACRPTAATAR